MRLFFALCPDPATQSALKALGAELREAVEDDPKAEKVLRLSAPRSLHWTLRFLGEIPICELPSLFEAAAEACAATPPLSLTLDKPLRLGTRRQPILCLGSPEQDLAQELFNRLEAGLVTRGFPPADRARLRLHLTLARQKAPCRGLAPRLEGIIKKHWEPRSSACSSLHLIKSQLAPSGSVYSTIREFEFGGQS